MPASEPRILQDLEDPRLRGDDEFKESFPRWAKMTTSKNL